MLDNDLIRHGREFARALDNHQYEVTAGGLHFPRQHVMVAGTFRHHAPDGKGWCIDPNIVPVEALNYLLKVGLGKEAGLSSWYVAPFVNNVVPGASLTAATAAATLGEFTQYTEGTRVAFTTPTEPVSSGLYDNSAAPAVFTAAEAVGTSAGVDIYGAFIASASTKSSTGGKLLCASLFTGTRNLKTGDKLTVEYGISASST